MFSNFVTFLPLTVRISSRFNDKSRFGVNIMISCMVVSILERNITRLSYY